MIVTSERRGRSVASGDLSDTVRRVATGLDTRGVAKGDVVGICSPNLVECPAIVLAVASLGAVVTPSNPRYTSEEVSRQLN